MQSVSVLILVTHLVVLGDGDDEQDGGDTLETVDPLLALVTLTSDIEHLELGTINLEVLLDNT